MENRYSASEFAQALPFEESKKYIENSIKCAQSGKSAIEELNKHYKQDRRSPAWSNIYWNQYVRDMTAAFNFIKKASTEMEKIREKLSD